MTSEEQETDETQDAAAIQAMAERLKAAVRSSGGNTHVAQVSGVPLRTLNSYMAGAADPKMTKLGRIAEACGTTVDALMGRKLPGAASPGSTGDLSLPTGDGTTMIARRVAQGHGELMVPEGFVAVPFLEVRASAGRGLASLPAEVVAASHFLFSEAWLRSLGVSAQEAELLQAQGDSMHPTIQDGDLMLVDRGYGDVVHGKIYALVVNDLVVVKRVNILAIGGMMLISDNDRYPSETVRRDEVGTLSFQGRVAWYGRAI